MNNWTEDIEDSGAWGGRGTMVDASGLAEGDSPPRPSGCDMNWGRTVDHGPYRPWDMGYVRDPMVSNPECLSNLSNCTEYVARQRSWPHQEEITDGFL